MNLLPPLQWWKRRVNKTVANRQEELKKRINVCEKANRRLFSFQNALLLSFLHTYSGQVPFLSRSRYVNARQNQETETDLKSLQNTAWFKYLRNALEYYHSFI